MSPLKSLRAKRLQSWWGNVEADCTGYMGGLSGAGCERRELHAGPGSGVALSVPALKEARSTRLGTGRAEGHTT